MISSYPSLQQYMQTQNNTNQYQNNYNQSNYNQAFQQNNNYSTNIYPQQNYFNNTNIFNNFNSTPYMQQQQQPAIFQGQSINFGGGSPMVMQGQMMMPQQPMMMQQQMMIPQQQQNSSSGFLQQLIMLLLPMLLENKTQQAPVEEVIEQTEISDDGRGIWGDPHFEAKGADGKTQIKFDHKGEKDHTYNVFQGDGYEVDAKYANWTDPKNPRIMSQAKIKAGADTIEITKDGKVTVNNNAVKDGSTVNLNDGTKLIVKGNATTIETKDGDSKINITNSGGYLNVDPSGKFSKLSGILGTAMKENRNLSEEESNKFDVTNTNKKIA